MKKMLIIILVLLFIFAVVRITTSTYENSKRAYNIQKMTESELIYKEIT